MRGACAVPATTEILNKEPSLYVNIIKGSNMPRACASIAIIYNTKTIEYAQ